MELMSSLTIRQYGDPVLKERTREVDDMDGALASLVDSMIETMYDAPGTGLATTPVGVQRRIFVYDAGDGEGAHAVINPQIIESDGEWTYDEGCLSIPGLSWEIVRPNAVHLVGLDLDGNEISIEASEFEGRIFQHELDHLDGILLVERLNEDQRKDALKILRSRTLDLRAFPTRTGCPASSPADAVRDVALASLAFVYGERVARLAYLGTPDMAVPPLRALVAAGHDIALCVTRPDRRHGRGRRRARSRWPRHRAGARGHPRHERPHHRRCGASGRGGLRAHHPRPAARADPDGEPALLAAAPLARSRAR